MLNSRYDDLHAKNLRHWLIASRDIDYHRIILNIILNSSFNNDQNKVFWFNYNNGNLRPNLKSHYWDTSDNTHRTLILSNSGKGVFLWICEISKNTFFTEHLQTIASGMTQNYSVHSVKKWKFLYWHLTRVLFREKKN